MDIRLTFTEKDYLREDFVPVLKKAMDAGAQGWHDELTNYPPQRAGVRLHGGGDSTRLRVVKPYRRTHTLGRTATHALDAGNPYVAKLKGVFYGTYVLLGTRYWAGWPGKLDLIKRRVEERFKAAFRQAA